jgi:hypothetical protein
VNDRGEQGIALVMVMLLIVWLTALGSAMTLAAMTETAIAASYREGTETRYAAEAAVEYAVQQLAANPDWRGAVAEPGGSAFTDGPAAGRRAVGPVELDLEAATRDVEDMAAAPPGGPAAPFVLYAFGRFRELAPLLADGSVTYVVVWIADRSGMPPDTAALDRLSVVAQAYGPRGSRRAIEVVVERDGGTGIRRLAWREMR